MKPKSNLFIKFFSITAIIFVSVMFFGTANSAYAVTPCDSTPWLMSCQMCDSTPWLTECQEIVEPLPVVVDPNAELTITSGGRFDYGAGAFQVVPAGYGLTAIGYGSDDTGCFVYIKTAPVAADGSVNFSQVSGWWSGPEANTACRKSDGSYSGGTSALDVDYQGDNRITVGWSWGASTNGGSPGNSGYPDDACYYQEYAPLNNINNRSAWGAQYDGTCNERNYQQDWLKRVVRAPAGRVIVAVQLSLHNDASMEWIGMQTRPTTPDLTASVPSPTTAAINTPLQFTSTIRNIGRASTRTGFNNFFQVATAANGGGTISNLTSSSMTALAASASNIATSPSYTFTTAGTYSVQACADKSTATNMGTITESNENNNCSGWTNVTVGAPTPKPDLTAGTISPTGATVGVAQTFSSTITNGGTAATGAAFTNLFQTVTALDASLNPIGTVTPYSVPNMPALAISGNATTQTSITFSLVGDVYIRSCADKSSNADTGTILESNEGNNCSAWMKVSITAAPQPDLTVSDMFPNTATAGTAQTFTATVKNSGTASTGSPFTSLFQTSASADGSSGVTDYSVPTPIIDVGGTAVISKSITFPSAGTIYIRACADKRNAADVAGTIIESDENNNCSNTSGTWTAVIVNTNPTTVDINAGSLSIPYNTSTTISWSSTNANSCSVSCSGGGCLAGWTGTSGNNKSTGLLTSDATYTISCDPSGPSSSKTIIINVGTETSGLNIIKSGQGTVTGTPNNPDNPGQTNVDCGPTCSVTYTIGTTITLTATPNPGRIFTGWSGNCDSSTKNPDGTGGTCSITIGSGGTSITANFAINPNYGEF
jgi:hypothetical protein